jgi:putative monooxygenase
MTTHATHAPPTTAPTNGLPDVGSPPVSDPVRRHQAQAPDPSSIRTVSATEVPANRRRGGDIRTVLAPSTCGATTGFMGTLTLQPGEAVTEHWHPYSEEFVLCVSGEITARLDGEYRTLTAQEGICIPIGVRHRLENRGTQPALAVFACTPLAPQPRLGHVDTEAYPEAAAPATAGSRANGGAPTPPAAYSAEATQ